ncbi:MAG: hypothetical protein RBG13Loki_3902 [Promethearchaeota archaeon CR_4]|nr:MAG: hypothetical protein RBG13Loki_3902 [Candidatus Lokiarchaeota archaeon CR_4]
MQKFKAATQKVFGKTKGNAELNTLISNEVDLCKREEQICKDRATTISALKAYAASQPDEIKNAVNEVAEQGLPLNQAETDKVIAVQSNYINKLREILEAAKKMDVLDKQKEDAKKAVEKASDNLAKKQKALEGAKMKGDAGKIAAAEAQLKSAEQEKITAEKTLEKLIPLAEEKAKEFQNYQSSALKDALKARTEAYKTFAQKYQDFVSGIEKQVEAIPAEEGLNPPTV